jgi:flagellar hook-associated protein FlgK
MNTISTQALSAIQTAITATSKNIANANTEGYKREDVSFSSKDGNVQAEIKRSYNEFIDRSYTNSVSKLSEANVKNEAADNINTIVSDNHTTLREAFTQYKETDSPVHKDAVESILKEIEDEVQEVKSNNLQQLKADVESLNFYSEQLAEVNSKLASDANAEHLLDLRDMYLEEMSELGSITTNMQANGSVDVFTDKGNTLVIQDKSNTVTVQRDPSTNHYNLKTNNSTIDLESGSIGARQEIVNDSTVTEATKQLSEDITTMLNDGSYKVGFVTDFSTELLVSAGNNAVAADMTVRGAEADFMHYNEKRQEADGVDLEKEITSLMQLRTAYEANIKVMQTTDAMFRSLINSF